MAYKPKNNEKQKNNDSLGFLFGYKESNVIKTDDGKTTFNVSFKSGMTKHYPTKFEKFKDFWSAEILVGQSSEIFINPTEIVKFFNQEFNEFINEIKEKDSFHSETFRNRRYSFSYPITIEQYGVLSSFSMAHMYINPYQRWDNDKVLSHTLKDTIGKYFKEDSRPILEIYNDYKDVCTAIYEKETAEALGDVGFSVSNPSSKPTTKLKIK